MKPKLVFADHGQATAVRGSKRFQYDLLHILFNNHHYSKTPLSHSSRAHFADRQEVNMACVS